MKFSAVYCLVVSGVLLFKVNLLRLAVLLFRYLLLLLLCSSTLQANMQYEINQTILSLEDAQLINEILASVQARFHSQGHNFTSSSVVYAEHSQSNHGPILGFVTGFIGQDDVDANASAIFTPSLISNDSSNSNLDNLAVELHFRNDDNIPPALRNKKVLLLATTIGQQPMLLSRSLLLSGNANHRAIGGFICVNPTTTLNTNSSEAINDGIALGSVLLNNGTSGSYVNVLNRVSNDLRKCYVD